MRHLVLCLCSALVLAIASSSTSEAQDPNGSFLTSISAGYTYASGRLAAYSVQNVASSRANLNGWNVSAGFRLSRFWGITADVNDVFGMPLITINEGCRLVPSGFVPECDISSLREHGELFTFAGGPRFAFRKGKFTPFAEALFGGAYARDGSRIPLWLSACTGCQTQLSPALAVGGGGLVDSRAGLIGT